MSGVPPGQGCGSCYLWIDGAVSPGVMGFCTKYAPQAQRAINDATVPFPLTLASQWCEQGVDFATRVPYLQRLAGSGSVASLIGTFTATAGSLTSVAVGAIRAGAYVNLMPTNSLAVSLLVGNNATIVVNVGVGFNVSFPNAGAAGVETFDYLITQV